MNRGPDSLVSLLNGRAVEGVDSESSSSSSSKPHTYATDVDNSIGPQCTRARASAGKMLIPRAPVDT